MSGNIQTPTAVKATAYHVGQGKSGDITLSAPRSFTTTPEVMWVNVKVGKPKSAGGNGYKHGAYSPTLKRWTTHTVKPNYEPLTAADKVRALSVMQQHLQKYEEAAEKRLALAKARRRKEDLEGSLSLTAAKILLGAPGYTEEDKIRFGPRKDLRVTRAWRSETTGAVWVDMMAGSRQAGYRSGSYSPTLEAWALHTVRKKDAPLTDDDKMRAMHRIQKHLQQVQPC